MTIRQQYILRLGARERLQEDPGEEPAHHLLRPSCARPDPPKRTQIKTPSPRRHIPKGNHGEPSIPRRNLSGEGSGREATGAVAGRNRRSHGARQWGERNGQDLRFPLSPRYLSLLAAAKNTGNAEREPEERRARPPSAQTQPTWLPLPLLFKFNHGSAREQFFNQL